MFNQHSTNAERKMMLTKLLESDSLEEEVTSLEYCYSRKAFARTTKKLITENL